MITVLAIETRYNGYKFRSRAEARWAVFFNTAGIRYEYEKEGFNLPSGRYLPDFFLPDLRLWFEVKGIRPNEREINLATDLLAATGYEALIAIGAPSPCDQLLRIPLREEYGDALWHFCDDRRNEGEFWLTSDDAGSFSIGPVNGPNHGKYPGVYSATFNGYEAAKSARFEFGSK